MAVSVHQLAVEVFKLDIRLHKGDVDAVVNWTPPAVSAPRGYINPPPTMFNHHAYLDDNVYPEGVADVVGYWAEDRILGGVAVFDRTRSSASAEDPPNAYWHSARERQTHRVYQLLDAQQQALVDFLAAEHPPPSPCPLPVLSTSDNRERVSAEIAMLGHGIYRDEWERMPVTMDLLRQLGSRPRNEVDYPEERDEMFRVNRQLGIPLPRPRAPSPSMEEETPSPLTDPDEGRGGHSHS